MFITSVQHQTVTALRWGAIRMAARIAPIQHALSARKHATGDENIYDYKSGCWSFYWVINVTLLIVDVDVFSELKKLSEESLTRQPEEVFDIICKLGEGWVSVLIIRVQRFAAF